MEKRDLAAMPLDELWSLHETISQLLSERIITEKQELEARLLQLERREKKSRGFVGQGQVKAKQERQRRRYPKVFPKYQNPKAPFETWSGRGKQPRWLVSALKAGGRIEDFEIPMSARGTARTKMSRHNQHD
jgi:DNA-binding protein H-NS